MSLLLVSTILKYIDKGLKNLPLPNLATKKWSKILLYVSSKNVVIAIEFIVAVGGFKTQSASLDMSKFISASKKTMKHCKSNRLNVIYKSGIPFVIISA